MASNARDHASDLHELEEFDGPEEMHESPADRVADWLKRLHELRRTVEGWVKARPSIELTVRDAVSVAMREELMVKFGVPEARMPAFAVWSDSKELALFRPKALWVIGANGRIDVITPTQALILVDVSRPFTLPTRWMLYRTKRRADGIPFTQNEFFKLLGVE